MPNDALDPTLLIFAALAIFVVWKLRSVLGVRTERDISPQGRLQPKGAPSGAAFRPRTLPGGPEAFANKQGPAPADRWLGLAEKNSKAWTGLDAIAAADPSFDGEAFMNGARKAYEMIVIAFAMGDRETLRRLLAREVFDQFNAEITARETRGETVDTHLVSLDKVSVEDAAARADANSVKLRFASKLISTRRDSAGAILEGGPDRTVSIVDLWTFERDPAAPDPNWKLTATGVEH